MGAQQHDTCPLTYFDPCSLPGRTRSRDVGGQECEDYGLFEIHRSAHWNLCRHQQALRARPQAVSTPTRTTTLLLFLLPTSPRTHTGSATCDDDTPGSRLSRSLTQLRCWKLEARQHPSRS